MEQIDYKFIDQVLADHACDASQIIAIMQDVQGKYRYLPKDALRYIADKVGISESKIYGVATFYENFSLDVKGKYVLKVCRGTACHVRKSGNVLQALYDATGLSESKPTSDDGLFTIEIVSCLGACGLSPVVMVNDTVHPAMTPDKAVDLIEELRAKEGAQCVRESNPWSSSAPCRPSTWPRATRKNVRSSSAAARAASPAAT